MNQTEKINILLVDDISGNLLALEGLLESPDLNIVKATSGNEALGLMLEYDFALVLLDVQMPEMDGFETAELMRGSERTKHTPIIFVTAISKEQKHVFKGYETGAVDYLFKPLDPHILISKVNVFLDLHKQKKSLERINKELKKTVEELEKANQKIAEMSIKDGLTGLYNRRYFMEALEKEVSRAKRYKTCLVLCMMDLDHFKKINDTLGHQAGDMVLSEFGKILKETIRQSDLLCRYGGEEFAVILPDTDIKKAVSACERFREMLAELIFEFNSSQFKITVSIGVASLSKSKVKSFDELVRMADQALYQAKKRGRNRVQSLPPQASTPPEGR